MSPEDLQLQAHLEQLKLAYLRENYEALATEAAQKQWPPVEYLRRLIEGEALRQLDRTAQRRIAAARFPILKTLDQFNWTWPKKINRPQVQNLFRLAFLETHANVILMGGVGLGKSHLAIALGYAACQQRHRVLFVTAVEVVNTLLAAQAVTVRKGRKPVRRPIGSATSTAIRVSSPPHSARASSTTVSDSAVTVRDATKGFDFACELSLSPRQRKILAAGGLLNYTREGGL